MPTLTATQLREILDYDSATGLFTWKYRVGAPKQWNVRYAGTVAGCTNPQGYVRISIRKTFYRAHRLAWLFVYGAMPGSIIDHINGDTTDNRIANLRTVTYSQNLMNAPKWRNNTSGAKGVIWNKQRNRWQARIKVKGHQVHLGLFDTVGAAAQARRTAEENYFGAFRRAS